jgi:hypothetical protein
METLNVNGVTIEITAQERDLLRATASEDLAVAQEHRQALAQVMTEAWRAGVLEPDTIGDIFTRIMVPRGADTKFPLDFYSPSEEGFYTAFRLPKEGAIPERIIEGDEVYVPTYKIGNAISWDLDYPRDGRWDVVARAIEIFTNGFVRKLNDDGWHIVLTAAGQNAVQSDSAAGAGVFTLRLLSTLRTAIKRLTGGRNSRLTDLFMSPEALADLLNLTNTALDDQTLRGMLFHRDGAPYPSLFGVNLRELHELGESQEYQTYLTGTVGASLAASDVEFCVGLDLLNRDSFVMPIREEMKMFDDPVLHRSMRAGVYGWMEVGFAALDTRRAILGSL